MAVHVQIILPLGLLRVSENGTMKDTREGAPLLLGGAGAQMYDLGTPRTYWPGRWTDPHTKTDKERYTTQHAGQVEEEATSGGERAHALERGNGNRKAREQAGRTEIDSVVN